MSRGHKLLTKELRAKIPPLYTFENAEPSEVPVAVKFFSPYSNGIGPWYATEGSAEGDDFLFFGWVGGPFAELGYFALSELEDAKVERLGITVPAIERDLYFSGATLAEVKEGAR